MKSDQEIIVKVDCRFFRGNMPCLPHKQQGVHCADCFHYQPVEKKILIIKLGAIGDLLRTTPLLRRLHKEFGGAEISWLTNYPEAVPAEVDRIYTFTTQDILTLLVTSYDIVYNLDKDFEACSLTNSLTAKEKKGFYLKNGISSPIDKDAYHKWLTGLFDDVSKKNTKSYQEEIFEICGFDYRKEEYILDQPQSYFPDVRKKPFLIGLNTGCGGRWTTRLWPDEYWVELAQKLAGNETEVILLGGPMEHEKNEKIARVSGSTYLGYSSLEKFISLVGECDLVVTGVTMALHIAIGLKKKIVLMNNIFNKYEFELYNLGEIIEPKIDCIGCYKTSCEKECMRLISPDEILQACRGLLYGV